jgi:hypothetical protein
MRALAGALYVLAAVFEAGALWLIVRGVGRARDRWRAMREAEHSEQKDVRNLWDPNYTR